MARCTGIVKHGPRKGEQCLRPAVKGGTKCVKHGGTAGRPVEHGIRSKFANRYPRVRELLAEDPAEFDPSESVRSSAVMIQAVSDVMVDAIMAADGAGHVCPECGAHVPCVVADEVDRLDKIRKIAKDLVFCSESLSKSVLNLAKAASELAVKRFVDQIFAVLNKELPPADRERISRKLLQIPSFIRDKASR